ncbi:MAG: ABC transporter substrate-binding protein [Oscillospiraceae bacterium]|nr:ABC transporter substrate-binding protein [Oscillospiraceae bacterium]
MKKILSILCAAVLTASLAACGAQPTNTPAVTPSSSVASQSELAVTPDTVTVTDFKGEVEVPFNPQRIVVLDFSLLDTIDALGLGDRVVGAPQRAGLDYLSAYMNKENIVNVGTESKVDLEAIQSAQPDLIIYGTRLDDYADTFYDIAPTIQLKIDHSAGYMKTLKENIMTLATVFGVEETADAMLGQYDDRVTALAQAAQGKNCMMLLVTDGSIKALGTSKRCSLIPGEIGFENVTEDVDATHGEGISFEMLLDKNPDYIFVLDRDAARGVEGAKVAQDIMDNDIVKKTAAYQNGNIVYLTPHVWYIAEGGISSTDMMLKDLEAALLQ